MRLHGFAELQFTKNVATLHRRCFDDGLLESLVNEGTQFFLMEHVSYVHMAILK
jgi:hypothetical protein